MMNGREWMYLPRRLPEFETGVNNFLDASFAKAARGGQIVCPCKKCKNRFWCHRLEVYNHLKWDGFVENYYVWVFHGEKPSDITSNSCLDDNDVHMNDNFAELLHDTFRDNIEETSTVQEGVNEEAKTFYRLLDDGKQELFPGYFASFNCNGDENEDDMDEDDSNGDENEVDVIRSLGKDVIQDRDQEDEDIDMMDEGIRNVVEVFDKEADYENEEDELVHEQSESTHLEKETAICTRKRGPTMMHGLQVRTINEREVIICNEFGQPVGPQTEEKDIVGKFSLFLGTIARSHDYAPLTYKTWHNVPDKEKEKMWEFVLTKYILPESDAAKAWVLRSIGAAWRGYKCRIKKKHFYKFKDNKTRWKKRPKNIPENDFLDLLSYWNKKEVMNQCLQKRNARKAQKNMHTTGPKSFARIREEMMNENPNREQPDSAQVFERTRARKIGNVYCDTYDDTTKKIELMKTYQPPEGMTAVDPFVAVMGKEHDGHCRLYGKGVTKTLLRKVNGGDTSSEAGKRQLAVMRKEIEEDNERKKAEMRKELEEDNERKRAEMLKEIEEEHQRQKAEMRKELEEEHQRQKAELRKELEDEHLRKKAESEAIRKDLDNKMKNFMEKIHD
ncbi:hypothetical protein LXL04_008362 [Taraxacum kok-saghyz]